MYVGNFIRTVYHIPTGLPSERTVSSPSGSRWMRVGSRARWTTCRVGTDSSCVFSPARPINSAYRGTIREYSLKEQFHDILTPLPRISFAKLTHLVQ